MIEKALLRGWGQKWNVRGVYVRINLKISSHLRIGFEKRTAQFSKEFFKRTEFGNFEGREQEGVSEVEHFEITNTLTYK